MDPFIEFDEYSEEYQEVEERLSDGLQIFARFVEENLSGDYAVGFVKQCILIICNYEHYTDGQLQYMSDRATVLAMMDMVENPVRLEMSEVERKTRSMVLRNLMYSFED